MFTHEGWTHSESVYFLEWPEACLYVAMGNLADLPRPAVTRENLYIRAGGFAFPAIGCLVLWLGIIGWLAN